MDKNRNQLNKSQKYVTINFGTFPDLEKLEREFKKYAARGWFYTCRLASSWIPNLVFVFEKRLPKIVKYRIYDMGRFYTVKNVFVEINKMEKNRFRIQGTFRGTGANWEKLVFIKKISHSSKAILEANQVASADEIMATQKSRVASTYLWFAFFIFTILAVPIGIIVGLTVGTR